MQDAIESLNVSIIYKSNSQKRKKETPALLLPARSVRTPRAPPSTTSPIGRVLNFRVKLIDVSRGENVRREREARDPPSLGPSSEAEAALF
jgi:hypothetical protein